MSRYRVLWLYAQPNTAILSKVQKAGLFLFTAIDVATGMEKKMPTYMSLEVFFSLLDILDKLNCKDIQTVLSGLLCYSHPEE